MFPRIDVRGGVAKKNFSGDLDFSFEGDRALIDVPYTEFGSPVRAELRYEIFGGDKAEVTGKLSFVYRGLCSRCLAEAEERIEASAEGIFSPQPKDDEYGYANGFIDLREFLRDGVLFALPPRLLCKRCTEETE